MIKWLRRLFHVHGWRTVHHEGKGGRWSPVYVEHVNETHAHIWYLVECDRCGAAEWRPGRLWSRGTYDRIVGDRAAGTVAPEVH